MDVTASRIASVEEACRVSRDIGEIVTDCSGRGQQYLGSPAWAMTEDPGVSPISHGRISSCLQDSGPSNSTEPVPRPLSSA